jgi:hypothetical protein
VLTDLPGVLSRGAPAETDEPHAPNSSSQPT